jgi:carboxypeptidase family protein
MAAAQTPSARRTGQPIPFPPGDGVAQFNVDMPPSAVPETLKELCRSADWIVTARVVSVLPARVLSQMLITDAVFQWDELIKGASLAENFIVTQHGGVLGGFKEITNQYDLIQPSERYILFLKGNDRPALPDVQDGMPRYAIIGQWSGLFRIDDGKLHLARATADSIRDKYEGLSLQEALAEIRSDSEPEASASISGHVYDAETGKPIGGAHLTLLRIGGKDVHLETTSDDSGLFGFANVEPARYIFQVESTGYAKQAYHRPGSKSALDPLTVDAAQGLQIDFHLARY